MARSSYQTLARFNDSRQSNRMPDIRQRLRDDLYSSRSVTKLSQLLKMRRLHDFGEHEEEDHYFYEDGGHYHELHYYPTASTPDSHHSSSSWGNSASSLPPSNAPSPSLSHDSDCSSSNSAHAWNSVHTPDLCDTFNKPHHRPPVRPKTRKEILETRKRAQRNLYDSEAIQRDYNALKQQIITGPQDPASIGFLVCSSWTVLSLAIKDQDETVARDALDFLTKIIHHGLIKITDVLFIMQQGLILVIKDTLTRLGSEPTDVIALLTSILLIEPRAAPFLIQLIADTGILVIFDEFIQYGIVAEALAVAKFYHYLFGIVSSLLQQTDFCPVVPETISRSTPTAKLKNLYLPTLLLKRVIRPALIETFIVRFFRQFSHDSEELFRMATVIIGHCLNFVHLYLYSNSPHSHWAKSIVSELERAKMDQLLMELMAANNARRCSNKAREDLRRFSQFYQDISVAISRRLSRSIR